MKTLLQIPGVLLLALMLSSCYTYKEVFNDKYYQEPDKHVVVGEKVEAGDWIYVVVNDREFRNLRVTAIQNETLSVSVWEAGELKSYHSLHIPYIQKLEVQVPDPMYTLGAGYSSLLVIFFLLV